MGSFKDVIRALLHVVVILSFSMCNSIDEFALKDDIVPVEKFTNVGSEKSYLDQKVICNQKYSCLIDADQLSKGNFTIYNDDEGYLYMDFAVQEGWKISNIFLFVGTELNQLPTYNNGNAAFDNYPYTVALSEKDLNNYTIILETGNDEVCYLISAKVVISGANEQRILQAGCTTKSSNTDAFYINRNVVNGLYLGYCFNDCDPIDFTFAFEDLKGDTNDADYNDIVLQAKYSNEVENENDLKSINMAFYATARGAVYDHEFKIRIPVNGKSTVAIWKINQYGNLEDSKTLQFDGVIDLSVFASTKQVLPANDTRGIGFSNSDPTKDANGFPPCFASSWKTLVKVDIQEPQNNKLGVDLVAPFDPYIRVTPTTEPKEPAYDLHIYEITQTNTFVFNSLTYPNGIIVPSDWNWPMEGIPINNVYPDFPNGEWYLNRDPNGGTVIDESLFGPPCQK